MLDAVEWIVNISQDAYVKLRAIVDTFPPEPTQPPPNMADFL